jgi:hypothetical protein
VGLKNVCHKNQKWKKDAIKGSKKEVCGKHMFATGLIMFLRPFFFRGI